MENGIEARIDRIMNDLLPTTAFEGKYDSPQSIAQRLAKYQTPGMSLAIIDDGEIAWAGGFGLCEAGKPDKVTSSTLFQAGSISKPVSALAVMRLVQEGGLDLDEDVNNYLTSWRVPANGEWQPRITLRQILSHTAGLTVHGFPGYQQSEAVPNVSQVLSGLPPTNTAPVEVNILPGLQFRYSGGGTTIAQQLLVDILGEPFPDLMRALVLDPLDMHDSGFEQPPSGDRAERLATAHPWKGIPLKGKYHLYPEMAAAGLWTTAHDLAKFGVTLLNILQGNPHPIFQQKTIEEMLRSQLPSATEDGTGELFGLGLFARGTGDNFHFGHSGWDEGFVAQLRLYKNIGKGAVIMLNSNQGHPMLDEMLRAIGREYGWPSDPSAAKERVQLDQAQRYVGSYRAESGVMFNLVDGDGQMMLQLSNQPPVPLYPTSELDFFSEVINMAAQFEADEHGVILALTVVQAGQKIRAIRVE